MKFLAMLDEAVSTLAPVMKVVENPDQNQCQFLILFYQGTTHSFFSSVTDVYVLPWALPVIPNIKIDTTLSPFSAQANTLNISLME